MNFLSSELSNQVVIDGSGGGMVTPRADKLFRVEDDNEPGFL